MSGTKTSITVEISVDVLRAMLLKHLKDGMSEKLADVIIGNLAETDVGLEQLYNAMLGNIKSIKFKEGENVLVNPNRLYDWQMDLVTMKAEGFFDNGLLPCKITSINPYRKYPVEVEYEYINKDTGQKDKYVQELSEEVIQDNSDEFLGDVTP